MDQIELLLSNRVLMTGCCGWLLAQVMKGIIYALINRHFDWKRFLGDGGMPSAHTATVVSMASAAAMLYGLGSFEFAVTCMLAIIVMHDAMGVRQEAGKQAQVINVILEMLIPQVDETGKVPPVELKEFIGHTPIQVLGGLIVGVLLGIFLNLPLV